MANDWDDDRPRRLGELIGRLLGENVGILLALGTALVTALRLLAVTRGDFNTAVALLGASNPSTVLFGVALNLLPIALPIVTFGAFYAWLLGRRSVRRAVGAGIVMWLCAVLALLLTPSIFLAVSGLTALTVMGREAWRDRSGTGGARLRPGTPGAASRIDGRVELHRAYVGFKRASLSLLAGGLLFGVVLAPPWWPPEVITSDEVTRVGYVIEETDREVVLLTPRRRSVVRIPSDGRTRQLCEPGGGAVLFQPLVQILFGAQEYPDCEG